jgi:hypothetical protein
MCATPLGHSCGEPDKIASELFLTSDLCFVNDPGFAAAGTFPVTLIC